MAGWTSIFGQKHITVITTQLLKSTCASLTLSLSQWRIFKGLRYSTYLFVKFTLNWSNIAMEAHFRNRKILSSGGFLIQRFQYWMITQLVLFGSKLGHTQNHLGTPWEREPGCVGCYDADFQRWGGPAQGDLTTRDFGWTWVVRKGQRWHGF